MTAVFVWAGLPLAQCGQSYAASNSQVVLGQAAYGESGGTGQKAGDQTGKEVHTLKWTYAARKNHCYHWTHVIRCNDPEKAVIMAQTMLDACSNDLVGYDRGNGDRQSFHAQLVKNNYDATKIDTECETSCTPLIGACVNAAGYNIKADSSADGLLKRLKATGEFTVYTEDEFTKSDANLQAGDILIALYHPHGAMVISSPNNPDMNAGEREEEIVFDEGRKYILLKELKVRSRPDAEAPVRKYSTLSKKMKKYSVSEYRAIFRKGTVVKCLGSKDGWIRTENGWIRGYENGMYNVAEYAGSAEQSRIIQEVVNALKSGSGDLDADAETDEQLREIERVLLKGMIVLKQETLNAIAE